MKRVFPREEYCIACRLCEVWCGIEHSPSRKAYKYRQENPVSLIEVQFDEVVGNIKRLVTLRNHKKSTMAIHVACCSTTSKQGTMDSLERIVDGFSFGKIHNWAGDDSNGDQPAGTVRKPCSRLWRTCTVLAGGDVSLCCLDYDGQFVLGHLDRNTTIHDVWHSEAYTAVRAKHKRGEQGDLSLCQNCTKAFL